MKFSPAYWKSVCAGCAFFSQPVLCQDYCLSFLLPAESLVNFLVGLCELSGSFKIKNMQYQFLVRLQTSYLQLKGLLPSPSIEICSEYCNCLIPWILSNFHSFFSAPARLSSHLNCIEFAESSQCGIFSCYPKTEVASFIWPAWDLWSAIESAQHCSFVNFKLSTTRQHIFIFYFYEQKQRLKWPFICVELDVF